MPLEKWKTKTIPIFLDDPEFGRIVIGQLVVQEDGFLSGALLVEHGEPMINDKYSCKFIVAPTPVQPSNMGNPSQTENAPVSRNQYREALGVSDIVSPDAPTTTNEQGGSQSYVPVRFDLIDAKAMFEMAKVLDHGAKKYGENNWRKIPVEDHLNHLLMHTFAYLAGDATDDHLSHILCRATFALGVKLENNE